MTSYATASKEYFSAVIQEMRRQGFDLLAWVTMNSKKNRYHVDSFRFSQEARLFFVPNKAFIVMLELTEHFGYKGSLPNSWDEDYYQAYWSGFYSYSYNWEQLLKDHYAKAREEGRWVEDTEKVGFFSEPFLDGSPFWLYGGIMGGGVYQRDFEQKDASNSRTLLTPEEVAKPFGAMLQGVQAYLYRRFRELQTTSFAPHYTFPEQERDFWAKFPLSRLKEVATHIWVSDFN